MKILQVNNVYAEKSTGKITRELHEGLLQAGHESIVVYGRGSTVKSPGVIRLCPEWYGKVNGLLARITGMPYGGCILSTCWLQRIIRRENPDVVHLQCINGYFVNIYRLIRWLKEQNIKTVVTLHAEFMYTGNCGHAFDCDQWQHGCKVCPDKKKAVKSFLFDRTAVSWKNMRDAFDGFQKACTICPVSPWTLTRAMQSDILRDFSFHTVYNGVNTRVFYSDHNQEKQAAVLSVMAQFSPEKHHPKGGWYLIQLAERMKDVTFYVAGPAGRCEDIPKNLILLGNLSRQEELTEWYRRAAVSLLVSKKETFSMPCAESLCCGTPVVGFRAGAPEQISLAQYSEFVSYGDLDALEQVLRRWLVRTDLNPDKIAEDAGRTYSIDAMVKHYMEVYRRML